MAILKRINHSTGHRLAIAFCIGIVGWFLAQLFGADSASLLIGWDIAAAVFIVWILCIILPMNSKKTSEFALREDPTRTGADIVLILASIASLGAVAGVLLGANKLAGGVQLLLIAVCLLSVILSWLLVHIIYTLRYAMLYYSERIVGGIDFGSKHIPAYTDFMYVAFTVGMTFQVSDTAVTGSELRKTILRHALLSYMFGTIIVATTINLVAGFMR